MKPKNQRKSSFSCSMIEESHINSLNIALTFKGLTTKIFFSGLSKISWFSKNSEH